MGDNRKQSIGSIISEFLETGDLSAFNETMEESVYSFIGGVEKTIHTAVDIKTNGSVKNMSEHFESFAEGTATNAKMQKINQDKMKRANRAAQTKAEEIKHRDKTNTIVNKSTTYPVPFNSVGEVSNVVCTVTGGLGLSFSAVSLLRGMWSAMTGAYSPVGLVIGGGMALFFAILLQAGVLQKKRLEKARRIAQLCGKKQYIEVEKLAKSINQSTRKTIFDIKKMIKKGFFPEGHIDEEKTTLMLSDSVYSEYMRSVNGRKAIGDGKKSAIDTTARDVTEGNNHEKTELEKMIEEGNEYVTVLHRLNADIPDEKISEKLNRLENLLKDIFRCVEKHPDQMKRMHEVMNYYIPTVIKLVEAYREYDCISEPGEEILDAKKQIEASIDTINNALKKILNNLFRDSVWDVTTDASVLNTMLAQKGLTSPLNDKED